MIIIIISIICTVLRIFLLLLGSYTLLKYFLDFLDKKRFGDFDERDRVIEELLKERDFLKAPLQDVKGIDDLLDQIKFNDEVIGNQQYIIDAYEAKIKRLEDISTVVDRLKGVNWCKEKELATKIIMTVCRGLDR